MTRDRGAVIGVSFLDHRVRLTFEDGSVVVLDLTKPADRARAKTFGIETLEGPSHIGNTPAQDHELDPHVRDTRPIRCLTIEQQRVWRTFVQRGAHVAVAGFETWRGLDRYLYLDVLGVGRTVEEAAKLGLPVLAGEEWLPDLRMVGSQLAVRMFDPWGRPVVRRPAPSVERDPGDARVWNGFSWEDLG